MYTHPVALLQLANSEKENRLELVQKVCYSQQESATGYRGAIDGLLKL